MKKKAPVCTPVLLKMPVRSDSIALLMGFEEVEQDPNTTYEICMLPKSNKRSSIAVQTSLNTPGQASISPYFNDAKNTVLYPFAFHCMREEGRAALYYNETPEFRVKSAFLDTYQTTVKNCNIPGLLSTAHAFCPVEQIKNNNEEYFFQHFIEEENLEKSYTFLEESETPKLLRDLNRDVIYPTQFLALQMDFIYDEKEEHYWRDVGGIDSLPVAVRKGWEILMLEPHKVTPISHITSLQTTVDILSELEQNFIAPHLVKDPLLFELNKKNITHHSHYDEKAYIYDHLLLTN